MADAAAARRPVRLITTAEALSGPDEEGQTPDRPFNRLFFEGDFVPPEEEYDPDDESSVESVFAFLPPNTADPNASTTTPPIPLTLPPPPLPPPEHQQHQQEPQRHRPDVPSSPPLPSLSTVPGSIVTDQNDPYSYVSDSPIAYPPPTFQPYSPSILEPSPSHPVFPSSLPPSYSLVPLTPPSADSHGDHASISENAFRLRRLNTGESSRTYGQDTIDTQTSRDTHVEGFAEKGVSQSAPNTSTGKFAPTGNVARANTEDGTRRRRRRQKSLGEDTESQVRSLTPSILEDDSASSIKMGFDLDAIEDEDSPFPEVRASVSNTDDPEMPATTFRMWTIGLVLCMISSALNVFFNFRQPAPSVVPLVLLLVSYPIGKFLAFTLPITTYRLPLPRRFPQLSFSLNPGPWNIKEHVLVYIMANVAVSPPYAMHAIVVVEVFYGLRLGYWFNLTLVLATQLTGFGLAGLCRRFLVIPASMVWPQNLVACTLLNTLHAEDDEVQGGLTRYKFYVIVAIGSFFFFFLPGYLFQALSVFSYVCWIFPNNVPVNQLFGVATGLGMGVFTFDWTQISWIGSPLMVPWWAEVHIFAGFVLFYWILTPILYYTNVWELSHFPITGNIPFDRFGNRYDVRRVLTPSLRFNVTGYEEYSPLYLPAAYAMTYLLAFALSTNVIVHTGLYHGRTLWNGLKRIREEQPDIHAKLMKYYQEVPSWWYAAAIVVFFSLAVVAVEVWDTGVPVWLLLLSIALPGVYILPGGFIFAMTGQAIQVNLLAQIIPGTLLPGNPLANMFFKAYAVQTLIEAQSFVQDLKLGHYIKVPPRATFLAQLIATILAAFVQVGTKTWMFKNVSDICTEHARDELTCPHNQVFFTASTVWGLIGPIRQFGPGTLYHPQLYALIIGAFLPLPFWLWQRRYPKSWVKYVSTPVVLNGVSYIPPATGINYSSWFAVGFVFQYWIRRRNFAWWSKFNYITSAALDSGTVLSLIFIFFTLQFPKGGINVNWWGNTVFTQTADFRSTPFRPIPPGSALPWNKPKS